MNRIFRFIYVALIVFAAVACHTSEIDNPNNDNPDKPKISENIKFTARIQQTRVGYAPHGSQLEQRWMVGDVIYGFYGGSTANKVVFSVESVDEETGVATLDPGDGWSGFISAFKANNSLSIGLVYTGCTTTDLSTLFKSDDTIEVDMTSQGTERIPACMHAESFGIDNNREEDVTYVIFEFKNDCSIIEVFSFTGVKEVSEEYFEGASATLGSIEVAGLIEGCQYSLDKDGVLQFESIEKTDDDDAPTTVTLGGSWSVTEDGDITYAGNIKPVYIAAVPFEYEEFTVSAYLDGGIKPIRQSFKNKTFVGGNSYYIKANPVVAKTVDDVYFKTVYEAFEHAKYLHDNDLLGGQDNTVTLIAEEDGEPGEIYGLVDHNDSDSIDETIVIDYPVTLDLNGRWLNLGPLNEEGYDDIEVSEYFYVKNGGEFKITDPNDNKELVGMIWSEANSAESLIKNEGTVIIENGFIVQYGIETTDEPIAIQNYGSLNVEGGDLSSGGHVIDSYDGSNTTICGEDAEISSSNSYSISIQGKNNPTVFTMTGGSVGAATSGGGVNLEGGKVTGTISGGKINGGITHALLVEENATCEVSGGFIYSQGEGGKSTTSAVYLDYASIDILGGVIGTLPDGPTLPEGSMCYSYAIYCLDSDCTISDVTIMNSPTDGGNVSSIYCTTDKKKESSFVMSGGSITGGNIKIWLDKNIEGEISDGTISSSDCYAIRLSGSELTIDEENDNTITISTGSENGYPAIFVEESESITSSLTIESGTISGLGNVDYVQDTDEDGQLLYETDEESGEKIPVMIAVPYCGAIQLTGNVTANIKGGKINSETGYAITVEKASECNISGNNTSVECDGGCVLKNEGTTTISGGTLKSNSEDYVFCPGTVENYSTITKEEQSSPGLVITGGDIVSSKMYALYNEERAMAIVTGGDLSTNGNDDAVVNYGDLIIGDPSAPTTSNDAITITSSNSLFPAIYCSAGGTFYMYYGTVKGPAGAVELNSGTTANIYGGNLESAANTIFIHNGSSCTISGGQFVSTSTEDPTVFVYNPTYGSSSSLTINGTPLFYSASKIEEGSVDGNIKYAVPVCAINDSGTNYVSVTIQGGYYYSSGSLLYCGDEDVLTISSGTTIYSNVNRMEYRKSGSGSGLYPYSFTTINDNEASPTTVSCFAFTDPLEFRYKLIK